MKNAQIISMIKAGKIQQLLDELNRETMLEDIKNISEKARQTKIKKHMEKTCYLKPTLQKYIIDNNIQYFTDSYFMVALVESDQVKSLIKHDTTKDSPYPNVKDYINTYKQYNAFDFTLNYNDIIKQINVNKANKNKTISLNIDDKHLLILTISELEVFLLAMNFKKDDIIKCYTKLNNNKLTLPININKENGSYGLLLPCRQPD